MPTSPSIQPWTYEADRPFGVPIWMIACFPDVFNWLQETFDDFKKKPESDAEDAFLALYGIDPNLQESKAENELHTPDMQIRAKIFKPAASNGSRKQLYALAS